MIRDFAKCPHCRMVAASLRWGEQTPLVNRSDEETFHLALFSGPYRRQALTGELTSENLVSNFVYVHDRLGPHNEYVTVVVTHAKSGDAEALAQVEEVADKLVELVTIGRKIERGYTYDRGRLSPSRLK